jgi:hypothetical protein
MAGVGQKYGISGFIGNWTFGGKLAMPQGTLNQESALVGITAGATRTQAGATVLTNELNRVDTSTAPAAGTILGDGVALPAAVSGYDILVWNNTANPIQVYANGSDTINGVAGATGIVLPPNGVYLLIAASTVSWACDGVGAGAAGALPTVSSVNGLTAFSGGGQGSALLVPAQFNRVTTVGAANDSVKLPPAVAGVQITIANAAAANSMNVFPATGEAINALGANAAYALAANKTANFYCMVAGQWHAIFA